ncbi:MAG: sulfatase, partial [Planctomycetales bacterium 12-60-4]
MAFEIPTSSVLSRRKLLQTAGAGFGLLGLTGALQERRAWASSDAALQLTHHAAKAKRVIFLFMNGAPSHVDTFDPKPALADHAGEKPTGELYRKNNDGGYMPSPFQFRPHGDSGVVMSELFPQLARHADDLCVVRSMHTDVPNHEPGLILMHSGHQQPTRPSLGSWCSYGLGSENRSLPAFVVLCPGLPVVGPQLWSSAFLPGEHQGMSVNTNDMQLDKLVANLHHPRWSREEQSRQRDLLTKINELHRAERPQEAALDAQIQALELAFRMQVEASDAFDISRESKAIHEL